MLWTHLILLAQQPPDTTAINDALYGVARLLASFLGGAVAIGLVFVGYEYMFVDSANRGAHLKKSLLIILGGALFVSFAVTVAPLLVGVIQGK